jgi:hypothetical protein
MDRPSSPRRHTRAFTILICRGECDGPAAEAVVEQLRDCVRASPHGVLIATGCLRMALRCAAGNPLPPAHRGTYALVQPCDDRRRPNATPTRLGPLTNRDDTALVCAWLRSGMPDDGSLPARLRAAPPPHHIARMN